MENNYFLILLLILIVLFVSGGVAVKLILIAVVAVLIKLESEKFGVIEVIDPERQKHFTERRIRDVRSAENIALFGGDGDINRNGGDIDMLATEKALHLGKQAEENLQRQLCGRFGWDGIFDDTLNFNEDIDWWNNRDNLPEINPLSKTFDLEIANL